LKIEVMTENVSSGLAFLLLHDSFVSPKRTRKAGCKVLSNHELALGGARIYDSCLGPSILT
jgi:hypothetical protein